MRKFIPLAFWSLLGFAVACMAEGPPADAYRAISPPQPTQAGPGQIEVVEVFWYGCPHCHDFEPYLQDWLKQKPDDVLFRRMPGIFRSNWIPHARAYYAAEALGVEDKISGPLFHALHEEGEWINDEEALKRFFVKHGVDGDEFSRIYNSQEVEMKLQQAVVMARRYGVTGVPAMVVNGKYLTAASMTGGYPQLIQVIDQLIARERERANTASVAE
jgi:thiol:disulfide interchange protein DsbA